jgi:cytosine/adenosine deaminase-related metal-dependent hydrolase
MLYPIWAGLDEDMVYASTRAGLAELALSGCTSSSDHLYVFPAGSDHFIDRQVEAAQDIGVRFHATRGSMDLGEDQGGLPPQSVIQDLDTILADSERVVRTYHDPNPGSMIQVGLAPCSPFSVSPDLMRESAQLARRLGVRLHTHIAETMDEDTYSREHFGVSPVGLLGELEWAESDVWVAHCVHPTSEDIDLLAEHQVAVAHCPTSNMLLGSGLAPTPTMLSHGISVGIGVDGSASNDANDLRQEVKQAVLSARTRDGFNALTVREALWMATRGGAQCLGRSDVGSIEAGKAADLLLFDADDAALAGSEEDLVAGVVLCSPRPHSTLVHGEYVVREHQLVRADLTDIANRQRAASARLMQRAVK